MRVQVREDGLSIDQIVLSHTVFLNASPGTLKNDTTILAEADGSGTPPPPPPPPPPPATPEIRALGRRGARQGRMAGGTRRVRRRRLEAAGIRTRNLAKVTTASATPAAYFEMTFNAEAGKGYRLWIRGKAELNNWANDSVFVQFSGSVTRAPCADMANRHAVRGRDEPRGMQRLRSVRLGLAGQRLRHGHPRTARVLRGRPALQTIRIQTREDGLSIDQIMLSDVTFATTRPGTAKSDTTIFNKTQ